VRVTTTLAFGIVFSLCVGLSAFVAPARAEPAYSAETVVALFIKDKALAETYKRSKRGICLEDDPECPKKHPPSRSSFDLRANFEHYSDQLTQAAKDNLKQFAKALTAPELKGEKFEIDAYANAAHAEQFNMSLSEKRALAVVSYLASQGVDRTLLSARGLGGATPRTADSGSLEDGRVEARLAE